MEEISPKEQLVFSVNDTFWAFHTLILVVEWVPKFSGTLPEPDLKKQNPIYQCTNDMDFSISADTNNHR